MIPNPSLDCSYVLDFFGEFEPRSYKIVLIKKKACRLFLEARVFVPDSELRRSNTSVKFWS